MRNRALKKSGISGFKGFPRALRDRIGRIKDFTANDFFKACKLGYEAIGHDCEGASLPELYIRYSDRRDEGLTGV